MKRYVLRFRGAGARPAADVARIQALPHVKIVDDTGGRMMLLEVGTPELPALLNSMPEWSCSEEQMVPLPDPRVKVRLPA